jgi:hypothetical protein
MTVGPGSSTRTIRLRVRKNAKPVMIEGLAYIFVKMLAGPHRHQAKKLIHPQNEKKLFFL